MKKLTCLLSTLLLALVCMAQYTGPGFYRVHNVNTDSYICIKGTHFEKTTGPDAFWPCALMQKDSAQVNDPGSIIYIPDTIQVGLYSQGVDTYTLTHLLLDVHPAPVMQNGLPTYVAYTEYEPDPIGNPGKMFPCYFRDKGFGMTAGSSPRRAESHWWIEPVNEGSMDTSYFAVKPASDLMVDADGYYWTSLCCDFPVLIPVEGGVEGAYTVTQVNGDEEGQYIAVPEKVYDRGEIVPAATPVLLRCTSPYMSENKLLPVGDIANHRDMPIASDLLMGNYFSVFQNHCSATDVTAMTDYIPEQAALATGHDLALGIDEQGRLGFYGQEEGSYMAANMAWLNTAGLELPEDVTAVLLGEVKVDDVEEVVQGDIDGDGFVNIDDVTMMIDYLLGREPNDEEKSDDVNFKRFDVNNDDAVNIDDLTMLIDIVLGK